MEWRCLCIPIQLYKVGIQPVLDATPIFGVIPSALECISTSQDDFRRLVSEVFVIIETSIPRDDWYFATYSGEIIIR